VLNFRSAAIVTGFDLMDSLRSRRAIVLLALYVAGAAASSWVFAVSLKVFADAGRTAVMEQFGTAPDNILEMIRESDEFHRVITRMVKDPDLATELVSAHPLGLFYGAMGMVFLPVLVLLTSCTAVSAEVACGSSRFALFRTDRLSWAAGKLLGQSLLLGVGVVGGAAATFAVGLATLGIAEPWSLALWLGMMSGRAWAVGFAYLGIFTGISQMTRSVPWTRALCFLTLMALGVGRLIVASDWFGRIIPFHGTLVKVFPAAHKGALWHPDLTVRLPAVAALLVIGLVGFLVGHLIFVGRDT